MNSSLSPIEGLHEPASRLGILVGYRFIGADDDLNLFPEEAAVLRNAVAKVRRQSGAARAVARTLFRQLGIPACAILKAGSGAPVWPAGVVGSLAHDSTVAIAAVARNNAGLSIGIDIEADEPMPAELAKLVATPNERRQYASSVLNSRQLFVVKEAVYKASFPIDGKFLDFQDVEVDLANNLAHTCHGVSFKFFLSRGPYLGALAIA